ncbi:MAG: hypothetical protein NT062_39660 [Proteobacteria bacterium]|nr:hypothetical protein [Pseudomonadota bacterium]
MTLRSPGGIFLPDPETRDQLLSPPPRTDRGPIAVDAPGERFAVRASSPYFVTDPDTWCAELDDPRLFVSDVDLADPAQLLPVLEEVARAGRALLVCAPAVRDDALVMLIANKLRGVIFAAAVDAAPAVRAALAAFGPVRKATVIEHELVLVRR